MTPRVLGVDPSLTGTAVALASGTHTIRTGVDGLTRLRRITREVQEWAICGGPVHLAVMEGPAYRALGPGHHESAGLWWALLAALDDLGVPVAVVPPASLKKYWTGSGNATKPDMRVAHLQLTGVDQRDDNRVDAHALRSMGMRRLGHPLEELPAKNLTAMDGAAWPAPAEGIRA